MSTADSPVRVEFIDISVTNPRIVPVHNIGFSVHSGEIHGILGDNKSGKSTIPLLLSGNLKPKQGRLIYEGKKYTKIGHNRARRLGIETVLRTYFVVPSQSVYENLFLNRYLTDRLGKLDHHKMESRAYEVLSMVLNTASIDLRSPIGNYNKNIQNLVDVARAFCFPSKLLILEDLSTRLDNSDLSTVRDIVVRLKKQGVAIIYISQHVDEIYGFADRVSVMKNGTISNTYEVTRYDRMQLVQMSYTHLYDSKELAKKNYELYYSTRFNESIINYLPLAMLITNTKGSIVLANKLFGKIFNVSIDSYWNKNFNELLQFSDENLEKVKNCVEEGEVQKIFFQQTDQLAPKNSYVVYLIPFYDNDSSFLGLAFLWINYLDNINFENQLSIYRNMVTIDESFSKLVHKIRNPLGIIKNYVKIIKESMEDSSSMEFASVIDSEIEKIKKTINRLAIDIHNRSEESSEEIVVLKPFLEDLVEKVRHWVGEKTVELEIGVDPFVSIRIDSELLTQVVLNVIINGVESIEDEGKIRIETSADDDAFLDILVSDTGSGIREENRAKIFEPFFSTKKSDEIRGLGLPICKDIMATYNGTISIESTVGAGSTFHIRIPYDYIEMRP